MYYDSTYNGYNMTTGSCGGNTYLLKTDKELDDIKEKIRKSKVGSNNPNAVPVKCKNVNTNEEYHFGSAAEMQLFFNYSNHNFITRRCKHDIKCLFKDEWAIAYEDENYDDNI